MRQSNRDVASNNDSSLDFVACCSHHEFLLHAAPSSSFGSKSCLGWLEWIPEPPKQWRTHDTKGGSGSDRNVDCQSLTRMDATHYVNNRTTKLATRLVLTAVPLLEEFFKGDFFNWNLLV